MRASVPYMDPERGRAYGREWMKRNPDKARAAMRRWRKQHPEQHAADSRRRYSQDPAHFKAIIEASPDRNSVRRAMRHRRRELTKGQPSFTAAQWRQLVDHYEGRCAYCGKQGPLTIDHRMPLARGGSNTIDNILPACIACNVKKRLMTEAEFRAVLARENQ